MSDQPDRPPSPEDDQNVARIAFTNGLASEAQIARALEVRREGSELPLAEILFELGHIDERQLAWLLAPESADPANAEGATLDDIPVAVSAELDEASNTSLPLAPPPPPALRPSGAPPRTMDAMLAEAARLGASDVHVHAGMPPQMRRFGVLLQGKGRPFDAAATEHLITEILTPEQHEIVVHRGELDFAYTLEGVGRFRANVYRQRRGWDAVFRVIPPKPPTLASLGLPQTLERLVSYHQGLVLVTGPAGCGKSATMAALVDLVNERRHDHVLTVEDPIEVLHPSKGCVVNQRQVARHTDSFANALRAALREDPDVIVIGELRDLETIALAISAAETGHLVLATLHTNSAIRTINRIVDVFPPQQQGQIRAMVSESLRAVVSQRLVPTADEQGRVPALEVLLMSAAAANLIREEKTVQMRTVLQTGRGQGMCLLDDSLADLVRAGTVTREAARRVAEDPRLFT